MYKFHLNWEFFARSLNTNGYCNKPSVDRNYKNGKRHAEYKFRSETKNKFKFFRPSHIKRKQLDISQYFDHKVL